MPSVARWDPFRDLTILQDAMGQLLNQAVMRPGWLPTSDRWAGAYGGQMNVIESDGRYYCQVLLPGVDANAVELTVRQNTLTVKATLPEPFSEELRKNATYLLREFGSGEFSRSISFPKDVDADHVQAHFTNGVLSLVIPIAQHAQAKRIAITTGEQGQAAEPRVIEEARTTANGTAAR